MVENKRNIYATIEARMGSSRLPGKVLKNIVGKPILEHIVERILPSIYLKGIIIATTFMPEDDAIEELSQRLCVKCYRGDVNDLRDRVYKAARSENAEIIVKLTGDNPLVDYRLIDTMLKKFYSVPCDLLTNGAMEYSKSWNEKRTFPIGLNVQIFNLKMIEASIALFPDSPFKEHVTLDILNSPDKFNLVAFHADDLTSHICHPEWRLTVDTRDDFTLMTYIFQNLYQNGRIFSLQDVGVFLEGRPDLVRVNNSYLQHHPLT